MENSDSKPRFGRPNYDGNRSDDRSFKRRDDAVDGNRWGVDSDRGYSDNRERRPYNNPNRFYSNQDRPRYGNGNRYGSNDRYGNREGYADRGAYGNREDNGYGNYSRGGMYGNREGRQASPSRFPQQQRGGQPQGDARYDGNKKVVFRKRKNSVEGQERKHFSPYREEVDLTKPIRLNKFLANAGVCSRREADDYIQAGVITVNGVVVSELGAKVLPTDKVMFHDQPVHAERKIYLVLNKPKDYVTTVEDTHERRTVMDLVKNACSERIYPVGRLDRNTTGVLLFTNDGDLAAALTHPKFEKKKIYHVTLDRELEEADFNKILNEGVELDDGLIKADDLAYVKEEDKRQVGIEIHSGKNRIVRRIFDRVGYKVIRLDRVYFAGLTKKNLSRGKYRFLTGKEISMLKMGAYE